MNSMGSPLAYTIRECANALRLSERTVHRLIKSGSLTSVRIGRAVRISTHEVERLIAEGTIPARELRR